MKKKVKIVLYGAPGVGKSTFASKAPNPLYICSDGNFEWLDLPEENGIEVSSWKEAKEIFANKELLDKYETIVLDLTEDLFKWCEAEFVQKNKLEHVGDLGFGKGYQITRDNFFIEISKLISMDKNIIMIMHETTVVEKDRRGVEHTKHYPSSRMPDKLYDMIEGRVRYFLRCYTREEEIDEGRFVKKRLLSLVPKPNEFGIARGLDESTIHEDILLDWDEFIKAIGLNDEKPKKKVNEQPKFEPDEPSPEKEPSKKFEIPNEDEIEQLEKEIQEEAPKRTRRRRRVEVEVEEPTIVEKVEETPKEKVEEPTQTIVEEEPKLEGIVLTQKAETKEENKKVSYEEKLAAIRAKLAKLNKQ